jgi:hypothetical protein
MVHVVDAFVQGGSMQEHVRQVKPYVVPQHESGYLNEKIHFTDIKLYGKDFTFWRTIGYEGMS